MNSIRLPNPCLAIRPGPVDPDVGGIAVGASLLWRMYKLDYRHQYSTL